MEGGGIEVTVRTPSRLQFGIVDMRGDLGRIHVSVGVAIESPHLILKASPASELSARGQRAERIMKYATEILRDSEIEGGVEFTLISDVPEHVGFGSGTQLALAVGAALSKLYDLNLGVEEIAAKLNRSRISGIGTHAFKRGGFIVDGGHHTERPDGVPPLIFRSDVPDGWFFVIGVPEINQGISGMNEREAFRELKLPPEELVGEVSRMVLVKMIPAILEHDIKSFGEAMTALDYKFGEYWIDVQGGRFSHPVIEQGVDFLLEAGAYGVGQSSWGPAFYGLVKGEMQAREITESLGEFIATNGRRGKAFYVRPNNNGAVITVTEE